MVIRVDDEGGALVAAAAVVAQCVQEPAAVRAACEGEATATGPSVATGAPSRLGLPLEDGGSAAALSAVSA